MAHRSNGHEWKFCQIRPDVIIGFTSHGNRIGLAKAFGLFLSMYASIKGKSTEVVFPGNAITWTSLHNDCSQDILARFHIHTSQSPNTQAGQIINVADEDPIIWEQIWSGICS